jgi:anti-sigma regulatory factor (Ser/Thr protein kinase)
VCRVAASEFERSSTAPGATRRWLTDCLSRWELDDLAPTAILLASELVTNAVVHGTGNPLVSAAVAEGSLEVGVTDRDPYFPALAANDGASSQVDVSTAVPAMGGRGLVLVRALADEWGVAALSGGKQVWFRLNAVDWSYRTACRCHADDVSRVRLESGRYALDISGPWDVLP